MVSIFFVFLGWQHQLLKLLFSCALTCIHSISQFYSWVAGAMGVKFLAQGNNSSRIPQPGIEPGTFQLPSRCPGSLLLPPSTEYWFCLYYFSGSWKLTWTLPTSSAWNISQTSFEELEAKWYTVLRWHTHFVSITGACALTIVHSVFSVMAGLIVEMPFMLFSVYNTV